MTALPTFLPLPEAARKYGLDEAQIRALVESGTIKAAMIGETIVVQESEVQNSGKPLRKEDLPEWKAVEHLKGIGIGAGEASEKYGVGFSTIFRWYQKKTNWRNCVQLMQSNPHPILARRFSELRLDAVGVVNRQAGLAK